MEKTHTTVTRFNKRFLLAGSILALSLLVGGVLAFRIFHFKHSVFIRDRQELVLKMAQTITQSSDVHLASGTYVPREGIILYSRINQTDKTAVRSWADRSFRAWENSLAEMPKGEKLTWIIDYGQKFIKQEVIQAPLNRVANISLRTYISASLKSSATTVVSPVAEPLRKSIVEEPAVKLANKDTTIFFSDFDNDAKGWKSLSGSWTVKGGVYVQNDTKGFDYITISQSASSSQYSLKARLRYVEGNFGAGFVYNIPNPEIRSGAQLVDLTDNGSFLRWGYYSKNDDYVYQGGIAVSPPVADGEWHTLHLIVQADSSKVFLDNKEITMIKNLNQTGHVGLVTSQSYVEFDDVHMNRLIDN